MARFTMERHVDPRAELANSLQRRVSTTKVADQIVKFEILPRGSLLDELFALSKAATLVWAASDDFERPVPAKRQLRAYQHLFPNLYEVLGRAPIADDPAELRVLLDLARQRVPNPIDVERPSPRRAVRKRQRFLNRFEHRIVRLEDARSLRRAQMQAKSRLAYVIDPDRCDDLTLALCAYVAARANRRSVFMVGSQSRVRDTIVEELESVLPRWAAWDQYALVMPTRAVIERLTPTQRGQLIGVFHEAMTDAAARLAVLWPTLPVRMRAEMVMVKGVDSSRWNAYAGAFNTMRLAWLGAVTAAGLDEILDTYCPGKAPRLMASDLAWMYRNRGMPLHEDTRMFNALQHPWEVIVGDAHQGRADILAAGDRVGVDADASGWVGKRAQQAIERPEPDPILVHGVVVGDPELAKRLRRSRVFSAKTLREVDQLPPVGRSYRAVGDRVIPRADRAPTPTPTSARS